MEITITESSIGDNIILNMDMSNVGMQDIQYFVTNEFNYADKNNAILFLIEKAADVLFTKKQYNIESWKLRNEWLCI